MLESEGGKNLEEGPLAVVLDWRTIPPHLGSTIQNPLFLLAECQILTLRI